MSKTTDEIEFERLVNIGYQRHKNDLKLGSPNFGCFNGAISKATMSGSGGFVEILYGPPDFHTEVFITSFKENRRWELKDLMTIDLIKKWLINYSQKQNSEDKPALEGEIEWVFSILTDGLKGVANFEWLN